MEYRTDRVAKPLRHAPSPSEVPEYKKPADGMVESWIEGLMQFFEAGKKLVDGDQSVLRTYTEARKKAEETVEHMKVSVNMMSVEVFEVSSLYSQVVAAC